jgi:subtilisin family serine protease
VGAAFNSLGLSSSHPWQRLPSYHLVEVPQNNVFRVAGEIYRAFSDRTRPELFVELVEPEIALHLSAQLKPARIGTGFSLTAKGASHSDYKTDLKIATASSSVIKGQNTTIAVLDSGVDAALAVTGWRDLTQAKQAAQVDNNGHGTAMTAIIADVARGAKIHALRVTDSGQVRLWDLMAGLETAVFDVGAHIVNMSLGLKDLTFNCGICGGAGGNRSLVFQRFFDRLWNGRTIQGAPDPIFLAAVGNDGDPNGFQWPAAFDNTVAIGAVTHGKTRSSFSNTGTIKIRYFLCPGGEVDAKGGVTEWVGEGSDSGTATHCAGTSASTAYAAAVLALYREYRLSKKLSTSSTAILDRASQLAQFDVTNDKGAARLIYGT